MNFDLLLKEIKETNEKWWFDLETGKPLMRNKEVCKMLIISEIAEAMEGARKDLMDDHLPHRKMEEVELADAYIRTLDYLIGYNILNGKIFDKSKIEYYFKHYDALKLFTDSEKGSQLYWLVEYVVELDLYSENKVYMLLAAYEYYAKLRNFDLFSAITEKLEYNKTRKDHSKESRLAKGGKKW